MSESFTERYSFEDSQAVNFPADGVCDWCRSEKPKEGGEKLKKCSGCSAVLYCSRKCQAEAWPKHKSMCRSHSKKSTAHLGYSSAAALSNALRRWASIHMWTLQRVVEVLAHKMDGGVDDHLANQHGVEFVLAPGTPDPADPGNPAKAFLLESGGIHQQKFACTGDMPDHQGSFTSQLYMIHHTGNVDQPGDLWNEREFLDVQWPRVEAICKDYTERMRPKLREAEQQAFAGFIPAAFHFQTTGIVSFTQYPLYRLRGYGSDPSCNPVRTEEQHNLKLFDEMLHLYVGILNMGMAGQEELEVLEMGRRPWLGLGGGRSSTPAPAPWGTVPEMIRQYHKLLAQRKFLVDGFYDPPE
ncbi:hypothetical protein GSI_07310 [Ganoderma sinense ZZ0214-1]|uniref:MYND-type domain-containing protein n=1 Tax=Ganoderma sinense ZZ0214-1 TaxID=1077348 RepID=A0A2G8SA20_9APHY|nr:hypothetical protein GSI_07310 [Ganoderma sinense ZZ0214-1]